jgi:AraC-like DNA-binding protein
METYFTIAISGLLSCCGEGVSNGIERFSPGLQRAKDYIHANWSQELRLDALSQVAGMSRFHFLRAFTRRFSLPPHAYLMQVRIANARRLLASGAPLGDLKVGFADSSHLVRYFKRSLGLTPGKYAKMLKTG